MVKKYLLIASSLFVFSTAIEAQSNSLRSTTDFFDEKQAIEQAKAIGINPSEINGYVQFLKDDLSSKQALQHQAHKHKPYEASTNVLEKVIYLNPASPQSTGCSNMGFEQNNFSGWTGGIGFIATGTGTNSVYGPTGSSIINAAGNNVSLRNTTNYHTLMSLPAINPSYPICNGYDSIACRVVGTNTVSEIPVVSPYSQDGYSVRMNSMATYNRACRLKYVTTTSSTNNQLSFSCALVMQCEHELAKSPYFIVQVKNETTGALLPGCSSFTINSSAVAPSDSFYVSPFGYTSTNTIYRKWKQYVVDLSSLPPGTDVSVNFEVGDCSEGGHYGYAYVDAECGSNGNLVTSNMCPGSTSAVLYAPVGYASYQWYAPGPTIIPGATNYSLNVASPVIGSVYTVNLTSYGGCIETKTVAVSNSTVNINSIIAIGTCTSSNSGYLTVNASGSNIPYTYTWTNMNTGSIVSNSQAATNLTIGDYSVVVSSGACGIATATANVPEISPQYYVSTNGSCLGGSTGSATVNLFGSYSSPTYTWTSLSTGNVVSNLQNAVNLASGNYSFSISSGNCGATSSTVSIPLAPQHFSIQSKLYCGNKTFMTEPNGTNYQWYNGTTLIPAPEGTNDTLYINNPNNYDEYTLTYNDLGLCKDSIRYELHPSSYNYLYFSNINNACQSNTNGSITLNISTTNAAPYNFIIDGPLGQITNTIVPTTSITVNSLSAGIYTATVYEGICIHQNTFSVNTIQTNFTMTPNNPGPCSSADTARIGFNIENSGFQICSLSNSGNCTSSNSIQIGSGTSSGTSNSYPAIYGNYRKNSRHQLLFKASELLAAGLQAGKISSISFDITAIHGATVYPGFTIKLKCTNATDLFSTIFDNTGLTQVFYSPGAIISTGWNTYQFPTAYQWDGTSNILVDVCNAQTTNPSANSSSPFTTTPFVSVRYATSSVITACGTTITATTSSNRPNVKFENCANTNYSISVSSNGTITHNYNNDSIKIVPVVTPTADIVYTITVTNPEGGCIATQEYTMTATPSGVITTTNASCGSCPNGSVSVTPSCGAAPYSYIWAPGGETTQSIGGLLPGCYTVTITDANGQTATESACVTFSTKLSDLDLTEGLSVYPNPNNGLFNVTSQEKLESLTITIINPIGQTVMTETAKNTSQISFDLSKLSKGIYYLKAATDRGSKLFKLILE